MTYNADGFAREYVQGQRAYQRGEPMTQTKMGIDVPAVGCPWVEGGPRPELYRGWVAGWRNEYRENRDAAGAIGRHDPDA